MKIKTWYFREWLTNYAESVEAKTIRGALTKIKKRQREFAEKSGHTIFCTIYENEVADSNMRRILVTYVLPNGDIKENVL